MSSISTHVAEAGRLLVRGSINVDEFFNVPHIVQSGETISSTGYSRRGGGKGANQAVAAAKAGAAVDLAGFVGHDGNWLRSELGAFGVGIALVGLDEELPTGRALIQLSTSTRDNSIVLLPGANFTSRPLEFPSMSYTHLLLQNEIPLAATRAFLSDGHTRGLVTLFNPSPMLSTAEIASFPWTELDWLLVNEGEGRELLAALGEDAGEEEALLRALAGMGGGRMNVLLTKGAEGVVAWAEGRKVVCGPGEVRGGVVDTTGAGDCFTGYFATLLARFPEASLEAKLRVASAAAAMCVEREGAMESVPRLEEVRERMDRNWPEALKRDPQSQI